MAIRAKRKKNRCVFFHIFISSSSFIFYRLFEFLQICTTRCPTRIDAEVKHLIYGYVFRVRNLFICLWHDKISNKQFSNPQNIRFTFISIHMAHPVCIVVLLCDLCRKLQFNNHWCVDYENRWWWLFFFLLDTIRFILTMILEKVFKNSIFSFLGKC